jgi:hypothetical protein
VARAQAGAAGTIASLIASGAELASGLATFRILAKGDLDAEAPLASAVGWLPRGR